MTVTSGLDLIQSFLVVAEELNFRSGAERMNIDQSALSRRIQKLEQLLDFPLFERTTRDVSLTPAGRAFYERNVRVLQDYSQSIDAARQIAEGKAGTLRISYMTFVATTLMPQAVTLYQQKYPHMSISLRHMGTHAQKLALANDEIDLAYIVGPFDHSEYRSIVLKSDPLCVFMPAGHTLSEKSEIRPVDLKDADFIVYDTKEAYYAHLVELFANEGVQLHKRIVTHHTLSVIGLVQAGMGVTVYPKSISSIIGPGIEMRLIKHRDFFMQTLLIWRASNRTNALRNFVDVAKSIYPR